GAAAGRAAWGRGSRGNRRARPPLSVATPMAAPAAPVPGGAVAAAAPAPPPVMLLPCILEGYVPAGPGARQARRRRARAATTLSQAHSGAVRPTVVRARPAVVARLIPPNGHAG